MLCMLLYIYICYCIVQETLALKCGLCCNVLDVPTKAESCVSPGGPKLWDGKAAMPCLQEPHRWVQLWRPSCPSALLAFTSPAAEKEVDHCVELSSVQNPCWLMSIFVCVCIIQYRELSQSMRAMCGIGAIETLQGFGFYDRLRMDCHAAKCCLKNQGLSSVRWQPCLMEEVRDGKTLQLESLKAS